MKILFILSFVLFHLPLAFHKDTLRRFVRMKHYNPDKAFEYEFENGDISQSNYIFLYGLGVLFSLFPLIGGLHINWFFAVIIDLIATLFVIPFIAFSMYPQNMIFSVKNLKTIGIISPILGFILYFIAK